jgi:hypothetical protein
MWRMRQSSTTQMRRSIAPMAAMLPKKRASRTCRPRQINRIPVPATSVPRPAMAATQPTSQRMFVTQPTSQRMFATPPETSHRRTAEIET